MRGKHFHYDPRDYVGKRFGERTVVGPTRIADRGNRQLLCRCDEGHEVWVRLSHLNAGSGGVCKMCHCRRIAGQAADTTCHPLRKTAAYRAWMNMRHRVGHDESYVRRGITHSSEWESFDTFLADMGQPPKGMELDRIDGRKGYEKNNCRWSTHQVNNANRTNLRMITYKGLTMCVAHWEKHLGLPLEKLRKKLRYNRPIETVMQECGA